MGANSSKTNNTKFTVYISPQRMLGAPGIPSLDVSVYTEQEIMRAIIRTGYTRLDPGQDAVGEDGPLSCIYFFNGYKLVREHGTQGRLVRVEMFQGHCWNGPTHNATNNYKIDGDTRIIHVVDVDRKVEDDMAREQLRLQENATRHQQRLEQYDADERLQEQRQQSRDNRAATANEATAYVHTILQIGTAVAPLLYGAYKWWTSEPSHQGPQPGTQQGRQHTSRARTRGTQRRGHQAQNDSRFEEVVSESESEPESEFEAGTDDENIESVADTEELERVVRGLRVNRAPSVRV